MSIPAYTKDVYIPPVPTDVKGMIAYYAEQYGVPVEQVDTTISCESGYSPDATHITKWERSFGVSQINLLAHPEITVAQAKDPQFAIMWLSSQFADGHQKQWTCWRMHFDPTFHMKQKKPSIKTA